MLCAGPLGRGQQGWIEAEEEEGQGGALTVRRLPNPITDCWHSAAGREGWTDRSERIGDGRNNRRRPGNKTREEKEKKKVAEREKTKIKYSER